MVFLLGIGAATGVKPYISIDQYFSLFVNVMLGISLVFELPVIIFFLTLIRVASPSFLLRHSRYAILAIVILAAIITPTPDVFNLTLFAVPMILLYFMGVFASYLLVMRRENRRFPWRIFFYWLLAVLAVLPSALSWRLWSTTITLPCVRHFSSNEARVSMRSKGVARAHRLSAVTRSSLVDPDPQFQHPVASMPLTCRTA